jgi:PD-(D/E)XK endonuclease
MERLINRRQQGDLGEASAIEWLTRIGATVLIPFGHSPDYDLVAEFDSRLIRIQVKTCTCVTIRQDGGRRFAVHIATNGGNRSWTGVAKRFDSDRVDYLFALVGDGRRWFIPAGAIEGATNISLGGLKYSEFEIKPGLPIHEIVYGDQRSASRIDSGRGSAGVGEPGWTVNSVALPEWVRIPPPPSGSPTSPESGPSSSLDLRTTAQTRISANHQVTIPRRPFAAADLSTGDRIRVVPDGRGRVILERIESRSEPLTLLPPHGDSGNPYARED